jgi:hypothetical protein
MGGAGAIDHCRLLGEGPVAGYGRVITRWQGNAPQARAFRLPVSGSFPIVWGWPCPWANPAVFRCGTIIGLSRGGIQMLRGKMQGRVSVEM